MRAAVLVAATTLVGCTPALPDDLPALIQAMAANDMRIHTEAARRVLDEYGVPGLLAALNSPLPGAKVQAARFLRLHPDPSARAPLLQATHHQDAQVRGWAAFALSALPSPEVESRLRELERDSEPVVRGFATESLEIIAGAEAKGQHAQ